MHKNLKNYWNTETLVFEYSYGDSFESTQRELSNEYQHNKV